MLGERPDVGAHALRLLVDGLVLLAGRAELVVEAVHPREQRLGQQNEQNGCQ